MNLVVGSIMFLAAPFILVPSIAPQLLLTLSLYVIVYVFLLRSYLKELRPATESVRHQFGHLNATLLTA